MSHETLSVLQSLMAYAEDRLPPYTCAPHGPGHKEEWVGRARKLISELQSRAAKERREMKYFLMDTSYHWVSVDQTTYENPPEWCLGRRDNMMGNKIGNKACVNPDGVVSISVSNILQYDLKELIKKLAL